jgi:hypothetical protein
MKATSPIRLNNAGTQRLRATMIKTLQKAGNRGSFATVDEELR